MPDSMTDDQIVDLAIDAGFVDMTNSDNPPEHQERAVMVRMSDVTPERIDWLWPGRLAAGKLHIIDGDPGLGKSTIGISWAGTLSTGGLWPDGTPSGEARGTVLCSMEDGLADTIRPRLDAHGADSSRVVALTGVRRVNRETGEVYEVPPVLPDDLSALETAFRKVDAAMVVIDPLMAYLGADVNSYRDQDVRRALAPLAKLAERTGVAVVIVRHLRKSKGSAVHSGGGSIGIIGAARIGFTVGIDPDDDTRCVIACSKTNISVKAPALAYRLVPDELHGCARVDWLGEVDVSADALTAEQSRSDDGLLGEAAEWLTGYLEDRDGRAPRADIVKAGRTAGHSKRTLERAAKKEGIVYESGGFPRSTIWTFPSRAKGGSTGQSENVGATELTWENSPYEPLSRHIFKYGATGATGDPSPNGSGSGVSCTETRSTPLRASPSTDPYCTKCGMSGDGKHTKSCPAGKTATDVAPRSRSDVGGVAEPLFSSQAVATVAGTLPKRVRVTRRDGVPDGAVYIGRPGRGIPKTGPSVLTEFGNPHRVSRPCLDSGCGGVVHDRDDAIAAYRVHLRHHPDLVAAARRMLAGRDLACWCPTNLACHGDVLLAVAAGTDP